MADARKNKWLKEVNGEIQQRHKKRIKDAANEQTTNIFPLDKPLMHIDEENIVRRISSEAPSFVGQDLRSAEFTPQTPKCEEIEAMPMLCCMEKCR